LVEVLKKWYMRLHGMEDFTIRRVCVSFCRFFPQLQFIDPLCWCHSITTANISCVCLMMKLVNQDLMWQCMHNYSGDGDVFCGDSGLKHGTENIMDIVDHFHLFFDKHRASIIQDTSRYRPVQNYRRLSLLSVLQGCGNLSWEVKFMLCSGFPCSVTTGLILKNWY